MTHRTIGAAVLFTTFVGACNNKGKQIIRNTFTQKTIRKEHNNIYNTTSNCCAFSF